MVLEDKNSSKSVKFYKYNDFYQVKMIFDSDKEKVAFTLEYL